ncbi:MAG: DUF4389 domain-containing protein [Bacteroidia bacterium]
MKLEITHQESYSRGELLARSFFGAFYILIPHGFVLLFVSLWAVILQFISFWIVLFTGKYPQSFFDFQVGLMRWSMRVNATMANLADGYPAFGVSTKTDNVIFEAENPETLSRGLLLVRMFFGIFYVIIPHMFILMFRQLWGAILGFIAWWIVLFTGKFPKSTHDFLVENLRWNARVSLYMGFMTDVYPPFNGKA